ncbi:SDR family oxidoreductase [Candidatus Pelagibacter bacterium nBUS_44]|uniref:SDR family oxidoreductase n=1 Tax=Candidatus Pelagibacter bacterium nBUS_44 TaxID=3374195 RepID=UPI003EB7DB6F
MKKIDVLINNAGISKYSDDEIKNFDKIVKINLNGVYYCSKLGIEKLKKSQNPRIINISSINAYQAFPSNPGYIASKGGILSLTRSLALDCQKNKINVNSISPGYFKTSMTSKSFNNKFQFQKRTKRTILRRWGDPKDLFGIVEFLISKNSSYITGQDFVVDGGWLAKGL